MKRGGRGGERGGGRERGGGGESGRERENAMSPPGTPIDWTNSIPGTTATS